MPNIAFKDFHTGSTPRGTLPDSAFQETQQERIDALTAKLAHYAPGSVAHAAIEAALLTARRGLGHDA
jgi:hypothetical protein